MKKCSQYQKIGEEKMATSRRCNLIIKRNHSDDERAKYNTQGVNNAEGNFDRNTGILICVESCTKQRACLVDHEIKMGKYCGYFRLMFECVDFFQFCPLLLIIPSQISGNNENCCLQLACYFYVYSVAWNKFRSFEFNLFVQQFLF